MLNRSALSIPHIDVEKIMKKSFAVLKDRRKIQFKVTRDSVCLGDDCDAPHKKEIECYSFLDPRELTCNSPWLATWGWLRESLKTVGFHSV